MSEAGPSEARCGDCDLLFFCRACRRHICLERLAPGSAQCAAAQSAARAPRRASDGSLPDVTAGWD